LTAAETRQRGVDCIDITTLHSWPFADRILKMACLPVPSVKKLCKSSHEVQMLLSCLSDPAEDFVQAVHCALHRSPCVILYTKQQIKNCCILPHKNFISSVSFNALHYVNICPTHYFHCLSAYPICRTLVRQANRPFSLCSVFL